MLGNPFDSKKGKSDLVFVGGKPSDVQVKELALVMGLSGHVPGLCKKLKISSEEVKVKITFEDKRSLEFTFNG